MDAKSDSMEKEVSALKEDMGNVKLEVGEIRASLDKVLELLLNKDRGKEKVGESSKERDGDGSYTRNQSHLEDCPNGKYDYKWRKLELPVFLEEDPYNWLLRVDRYFALNQVTENEKIPTAVVCMEGRALSWYHWQESRAPLASWDDFKKELLKRFKGTQEGSGYESLVALRQIGTVMEYLEKFELIATPLTDVGEDMLVGTFINGLREEVKAELRLVQPMGLSELMEKARRIEERNWALERAWRANSSSRGLGGNPIAMGQAKWSRELDTGQGAGMGRNSGADRYMDSNRVHPSNKYQEMGKTGMVRPEYTKTVTMRTDRESKGSEIPPRRDSVRRMSEKEIQK